MDDKKKIEMEEEEKIEEKGEKGGQTEMEEEEKIEKEEPEDKPIADEEEGRTW